MLWGFFLEFCIPFFFLHFLTLKSLESIKTDATSMFGYNNFKQYGSRYASALVEGNAPFFYQQIIYA